jgi:chromate reductase
MEDSSLVRLLAISGSLRRGSSNSALVEAVAILAPDNVDVSIYRELAQLPPFNPDCANEPPPAVVRFQNELETCDAILISSPEYAHGVPGVLKNALDWVVASGELIGKAVGLINTSTRATHAWTSLAETLTVMSARLIPGASIAIPLPARPLGADGIVSDPGLAAALRSAIVVLAAAAREKLRS